MAFSEHHSGISISSENIVPYAPLEAGQAFMVAPSRGEFYNHPHPLGKPFVEINEEVNEGVVIGLFERMKVFEEVVVPTKSRVLDLEANATMVTTGHPIARIALLASTP